MATESRAPFQNVHRVQLSILSPEEIRRMSVTKGGIKYSEIFENGRPKMGGLMDPRQGFIDQNTHCTTCGGTMNECPRGHFGHMDLAKPVYNVGFLAKVGRHCNVCASIAANSFLMWSIRMCEILTKSEGNPRKRFDHVYNLCKGKMICDGGDEVDMAREGEDSNRGGKKQSTHGGCGRYQPEIKRSGLKLMAEWKHVNEDTQERQIMLTAERVWEIFRHISGVSEMQAKY